MTWEFLLKVIILMVFVTICAGVIITVYKSQD